MRLQRCRVELLRRRDPRSNGSIGIQVNESDTRARAGLKAQLRSSQRERRDHPPAIEHARGAGRGRRGGAGRGAENIFVLGHTDGQTHKNPEVGIVFTHFVPVIKTHLLINSINE